MKRVIVAILAIGVFVCSCNDSKNDEAPTVVTNAISSISVTTASCGGNVTAEGSAAVIARGVCWSTSQNPTSADSKTSDSTGSGEFTSALIGLSPNTTYYVKAYATNSVGTSYGSGVSFTTSPITIPALTTSALTNIMATTASCGGNITSDGGAAVTARGVCWSTTQNPTIVDSKTTDGAGAGAFVSSIIGLSPNTTYYVRAYATNSAGTSYGTQGSFKTSLPFIDFTDSRDGRIYKTIQIGTQVWMAENVSYMTADSSWYYNNDSTTYHAYGRIYSWNRALEAVPVGWHLPTDAEWTILTTYLGGEGVAGGKLKETGFSHWTNPNTGATNETGFTGLPGGVFSDGSFEIIGFYGSWWSATETPSTSSEVYYRLLNYNNGAVGRASATKTYGISVRCIKD